MVDVILGCKNRIYRNHGMGRLSREKLCPNFDELVFNVTLDDLTGDGVIAIGHNGVYLIEGQSDGAALQRGENGVDCAGEGARPDGHDHRRHRCRWRWTSGFLSTTTLREGADADAQSTTPTTASPATSLINDGSGNLGDNTVAAGLEAGGIGARIAHRLSISMTTAISTSQ